MNLKKGFVFVIDTNEYAGNFEREMCAHITGQVGECGVGDEFVDEKVEMLFEPYIKNVSDDNGCSRPCEAISSPDGGCNSVAIYFESQPTGELITIMKERATTFNNARKNTGNMAQFYQDSKIEVLGFRLLEVNQTINEIGVELWR